MDKYLQLYNEILELLLSTKNVSGLSASQKERLKILFSCLSNNGREHIELWCEDNDITVPKLN